MSDIAAIGAMIATKELGLEIPEDIAVAGFDDIQESMLVSPHLTTIHQPDRDKGAEAARMVMNMLDGSSGQHIKLPYQLIVREST
jgi:DNA-binding LacI/PurR family transcriptional regulator